VFDEQAALEAMLSVLMAKLNGGNLIHDVGYMESGLTLSYEMIVLTDELIAMCDNLIKGIEITPETMLLDEVHQVGPGGHFLNTEETMSRFRSFWYPGLLDRMRRETWLENGGQSLGERLRKRVKEILAAHQPRPLAEDKVAGIQEILGKVGVSV
jgi:trimethylamine--corrinoid protein Co-methyltransferase